ncbi:MAG: DUF488 domain-containing protein [Ignavibacteriales bacterium]|nr:MAG: DUF488 domain-containing protein [Ignavibacteriales bacterium]
MYYRRIIILAILDSFNGELDRLKLQALLFLFVQQSKEKIYSFVPSESGCHSFHAEADLSTMQKYKQVKAEKDIIKKTDKVNYPDEIDKTDKEIISGLAKKYKKASYEKPTREIFLGEPYYAINCNFAGKILEEDELLKVSQAKPVSVENALFTIGYEGLSPEEYLNRLIRNDIKVLCDVRRNPLSMKYGFSKKQLAGFCEALNIKYIHFPKLGVESSKRKELKSQKDYDEVFAEYRQSTLKENISDQQKIIGLIKNELRVAITCFEADVNHCHRNHLASSLEKFNEWKYRIIHI